MFVNKFSLQPYDESLSIAVGIIGATVMPHSLFLGSTLATQDRIEFRQDNSDKTGFSDDVKPSWIRQLLDGCKESVLSAFRKPPSNLYAAAATRYADHTNNSHEFVQAHIYHGTVDMIGSLLGFAVVINSLCVRLWHLVMELMFCQDINVGVFRVLLWSPQYGPTACESI